MARAISLFAFLLALLFAGKARAQLHWDAGAQVGVAKRFLANRPSGAGDAGFGPVGELHGHVAILPLLRIGPYLAHDISPMPGDASAFQITSFGARVKVTSPLPLDPLRVWVFAGFGYAAAYGPSYHTSLVTPQGPVDALVNGAGGGFFEVPFGIGASYKFRRPWCFTAELGGRAGLGFHGSLFDAAGRSLGTDTFGLSLMLGVMIDN